MTTAQVDALKIVFDSVSVELKKQIQTAIKLPVRPKTFRLILTELEVKFDTNLSVLKCGLKPRLSILKYGRSEPDHAGNDSAKHMLSMLSLSEKLHTRARRDLADFYGV